MLRLKFWAAAGLLAGCGAVFGALEASAAAPSVVVTIAAAGGAGEFFRPVIADALSYKLQSYSLEVTYRDELTGVPRSPAGTDADFLLNCRYSQTGAQMEIRLGWRDQQTGLLVAAVERQGQVDLVLDALILEALDELLGQVQVRIPGRLTRAPTAPGVSTGAGSAVQVKPGSLPASAPVQPAAPAALPEVPSPGQPGFVLSPSLAPFVAVGAASYYFPVGIQSLVRGDFLPKAGRGRLGLGALLGVTVFQAQGATEQSITFLVPVGVSLRYELELGPRWNLLFQLAGGPALLAMGLESQGTLAKVLPFVRSGIGAELMLASGLGLALDAAYEVYFESPYLIMGFAPSVSLGWRL